jgi:hypothetical protein
MSFFSNIDPILLFFFLGVLASYLKSDLELPESISKFLSIFLLLSLGLKGGYEVSNASELENFSKIFFTAMIFCLLVPLIFFQLFKQKLGYANAAALAASYGSVSAVTFIAGKSLLENENIPYSGFMVAIMALMEVPAILVALGFYNEYKDKSNPSASSNKNKKNWFSIFKIKSVVLLLGGFIIGYLMGDKAWLSVKPVISDSFKGVLVFFLLDLGVLAQRQLKSLWKNFGIAFVLAIIMPLIFGTLSLIATSLINIDLGNRILLAALIGSASYIAAPAAIKSSIPEANPSFFVALPLAITFPMNVIFGIPYYLFMARIF